MHDKHKVRTSRACLVVQYLMPSQEPPFPQKRVAVSGPTREQLDDVRTLLC